MDARHFVLYHKCRMKKGDKVKIESRLHGHQFEIGEYVEITDITTPTVFQATNGSLNFEVFLDEIENKVDKTIRLSMASEHRKMFTLLARYQMFYVDLQAHMGGEDYMSKADKRMFNEARELLEQIQGRS